MKSSLSALFLFITLSLMAQDMPIRLPAILSDHAVLQQSAEVKLWGWGPSTRDVAIVASWAPNDTVKALVAIDCTWHTIIRTPKAGGFYTISFINDKDKVTISDILVGEVWLCSGQSNMELRCNDDLLDGGDALKAARNNEIRFFQVENTHDIYPLSDCKGKWVVCDSSSLKNFSAVGYFFGSNLQKALKVPVGLISACWGATSIQPWMPKDAFENEKQLQEQSHFGTAWAPQGTSILYNAMIHPLTPYSISGVIWYQGESNALTIPEAKVYGSLLKNLIQSWRVKFEAYFPFYYIQIAPFDGYYPKDAAAYLREQQEIVLEQPKTGMITIGDLVDDVKNIHPRLKAAVGNRLANLVLKEQYHFDNLQPYSPRFSKMEIENETAHVTVASIGKLYCKESEIKSFQIAGKDKIFYPAKASISENGEIVLQSKKVFHPVTVRYCFSNEEMPNLFDTNGLPLMPFRTDKW